MDDVSVYTKGDGGCPYVGSTNLLMDAFFGLMIRPKKIYMRTLRSYPHREVGYMPRKGPAIRLELPPVAGSEMNQIYVFVCSDANKVKDILMAPRKGAKEVE